MKKLTREDYIKKCNEKHNYRYSYSLVVYENISTRIEIICNHHGIFKQIAKNHKDGQGCPKCAGRGLSRNEYIKECNRSEYDYLYIGNSQGYIIIRNRNNDLIYRQSYKHHLSGKTPTQIEKKSLFKKLSKLHNNKYSYHSDKDYLYNTDRIILIDKESNDEFRYRVDRHLSGMEPNKVTLNRFIIKSNNIHNNKYDYSKVRFDNIKDKVKIICPKHGQFKQCISNHMNLGNGCPECAHNTKWNTNKLAEELNKIHFNKYDYSLLEYNGIMKKIKILCIEHGEFIQTASKHLSGQGCPQCSYTSKGEEYIKEYLENNNIKYIQQQGFDDCKHINKLNFDFYLPEMNLCIEFDGIQHFKPVDFFGGKEEFIQTKLRDKSKNEWCNENNVELVRIKYNEITKISNILDKKLYFEK